MDLKIAALTDTGRARANNEDSLLADPPLIAIADGMGGHEGGEVASSLAVEVLKGWKDKLEGRSPKEATDELTQAFHEANRVIFERGSKEEAIRGMGTTLTAAWVGDDKVALAHVGDSRAYLLRGGKLEQLTEDQNVAQEWVRRGRLTEQEAASSPHRHIILQAIGQADGLDVATVIAELRAGDKLVLASDGLFGMIQSNDALRDILLAHPDNDEACRALIDAANEAGGADNISVVILEVTGDPDAVAAAADEDHVPVVIERGETPKAPRSKRSASRVSRIGLVISGLVILVGLMLFLLFRPTGPNYVLSTRDGVIVVLDGKVGTTQDPQAKGEVVRRYTDRELEEFPPYIQRQFRMGFEVDSIADAEEVLRQQVRQLGPGDTPTPEPKGSESPKPTPKPTPKETP